MSKEEPAVQSPQGRSERKLAAILSADVKGYSRLMGEDEVATIRGKKWGQVLNYQ